MKHNYTEKKIIQFIYGECDIFDRLEIEDSLQHDLCLRENYDELYRAYKSLPKVTFSPQNQTIKSILKYGKDSLQAIC